MLIVLYFSFISISFAVFETKIIDLQFEKHRSGYFNFSYPIMKNYSCVKSLHQKLLSDFVIFFIVLLFLPLLTKAQISSPAFNWKSQEISKDNNLQGMAVHDDNTAVIAGMGKTFKITRDKGISWDDAGLLNPKYNFNDISITGNVGYMVARKTLLVDNPSAGEDDVYVSGVLLKTTDGGQTWNVVNLSNVGEGTDPGLNPNAKGCITLNPYSVLTINESTALLFLQWYDIISGVRKTHSAVFKTVNGGGKWTAITGDFAGAFVTSIRMFGTDIYIGGNKILLKGSTSTDTTTDIFPAFSAVAGSTAFINDIHSFGSGRMTIVTTNGVYSSADSGVTFSKLTGASGGFDFFQLDEKTMISLGALSVSKATKDGGVTWVSCFPGKTCFEIPGVFNDSLYVLSAPVIYKMSVSDLKAGNYHWVSKTLASGSSNLQKMYQFDTNSAMIVGDDQIAKKTVDKGLTWTDIKLPPMYLFDGNYDYRSVSASELVGYATTRMYKLVDFPTGDDYILNGLIFKTEDAWKTWKVLNTKNVGKSAPTDASKYPLMTGCYAMDNYTIECVNAQTAYLNVCWYDSVSVSHTTTKHSRVFKTADGGNSWVAVTKDFGSAVITSIKFSGETGYISGNKILMKTSDGGNSFTDLYPKITVGADSLLIINSITMRNKDELYFQTSNNKGVFYTKDGGSTFSKLSGVNGGLDFVALDDNSFMSLGSSTLNKFSNDGGLSWKDAKLGGVIYAAGKVLADSLYVLGKSNVYKIAVSDLDIKTLVADIKAANALKVLYGASALQLTCDEGDIDRCFIYNISGQMMAIADPKSSTYSIDYNSFTPGIYIISALINGKKYTQKVVLN